MKCKLRIDKRHIPLLKARIFFHSNWGACELGCYKEDTLQFKSCPLVCFNWLSKAWHNVSSGKTYKIFKFLFSYYITERRNLPTYYIHAITWILLKGCLHGRFGPLRSTSWSMCFNGWERQGQTAANHKRICCCIDYHAFITYTRMAIATCRIARVNGPLDL